jgi:hypothetical protein
MKNTLKVLLSSVLLIALGTACEKNDEPSQLSLDQVVIDDAENEAFVESTLDEVDDIAYYAMLFAENGRVADEETDPIASPCVTRTLDKENRIVTITFSDEGCPDWRGRVRRGTIIIDYDGRWYEPGAMQTITFVDFSIDGKTISGQKVRVNVSESIQDFISIQVSFDITVTFEDETSCSREGVITRKRVRMPNPIDDQIIKKGSWTGTNRRGYTYSVSIDDSNPVVWQRGCLPKARIFIPVSGVKHKTVTDPEGNVLRDIQINYGDGTCDNIIEITNLLTGAVKTHEVKKR